MSDIWHCELWGRCGWISPFRCLSIGLKSWRPVKAFQPAEPVSPTLKATDHGDQEFFRWVLGYLWLPLPVETITYYPLSKAPLWRRCFPFFPRWDMLICYVLWRFFFWFKKTPEALFRDVHIDRPKMLEQGHLLSKTWVERRWSWTSLVTRGWMSLRKKQKLWRRLAFSKCPRSILCFFHSFFFAHRFFSQKQNANKNHGSLMPLALFSQPNFQDGHKSKMRIKDKKARSPRFTLEYSKV